jgi:hypothetical protein
MFDPSALTAGLVKAAAPTATDFLKKVGKRKYDKFIATYTNVFKDHIRATLEKCSSIKTILHRDEAVSLESQYVHLILKSGSDVISDETVISQISRPAIGALVSGLAGSGKSMFMKWAALQSIEALPTTQRIPLFIEIRDVSPEILDIPFDQVAFRVASSEMSNATFEQFFVGLTEGQFIILVDGLDEVPVKYRTSILTEISDFCRRFPKASLLCSSRPDQRLESSSNLKVYHIQDMTIEQIVSVIDRALFDEKKKAAFIAALRERLYYHHTSFLSNPLLATIMLITYDVRTGVPSKLSLFYSQVYEALFYKHDSSKGVYVREHYTGLDIDEFEAVFRTFCFQTYAASRLSFESSDLMELIRSSIAQARVTSKAKDFVEDCKKSLCLLQEDGLLTSFVHKSFQEYFAAKFLSAYGGTAYASLVDEMVRRGIWDNAFKMLCEINPEDVLRRWCKPKISEILKSLDEVDLASGESVHGFLKSFASEVYFQEGTGEGISFSWGFNATLRFIYAINTCLSAASISDRVKTSGRNFFKNLDPETLPEEMAALLMYEQEEDEEGQQDEEYEPRFTGRQYVDIGSLKPGFVLQTGLPSYICDLRDSFGPVLAAVDRRLQSSDDFARRITQLFSEIN